MEETSFSIVFDLDPPQHEEFQDIYEMGNGDFVALNFGWPLFWEVNLLLGITILYDNDKIEKIDNHLRVFGFSTPIIRRCSWPNIAFIIGLLFQSNPLHQYMGAVKHIMQYLAGTASHRIILNPLISKYNPYVFVHSNSSFVDPQIVLHLDVWLKSWEVPSHSSHTNNLCILCHQQRLSILQL